MLIALRYIPRIQLGHTHLSFGTKFRQLTFQMKRQEENASGTCKHEELLP